MKILQALRLYWPTLGGCSCVVCLLCVGACIVIGKPVDVTAAGVIIAALGVFRGARVVESKVTDKPQTLGSVIAEIKEATKKQEPPA